MKYAKKLKISTIIMFSFGHTLGTLGTHGVLGGGVGELGGVLSEIHVTVKV
jgi:hypothetical protein